MTLAPACARTHDLSISAPGKTYPTCWHQKWATGDLELVYSTYEPSSAPTPGRSVQTLSDEHMRVMGSIVTALGHLHLALLWTVRDLVPGADGPSVEALLAGDSTLQLAAKFDRLVKQQSSGRADLCSGRQLVLGGQPGLGALGPGNPCIVGGRPARRFAKKSPL